MPIRTGAERAVEGIHEVLRRRERATADLVTVRVVGRNEDGTTQVQRLDGECVQRGCADNRGEGETFQHPRQPCFSPATGTTGVALLSQRGAAAVLWVERLDPPDLPAGAALQVQVHGRGFKEETRFEFLRPGTIDVNPDVEITGQELISSEQVTLDVLVAAGAELVRNAPIAYDNPGAAF
ncbi:MAG TPA: hypothetical protein VNJ70_17885 [Thermoanaerobaculia bacterium]|nr:hypothetical protein [Thermoanaerobaculia bacterium]